LSIVKDSKFIPTYDISSGSISATLVTTTTTKKNFKHVRNKDVIR